MTPSSRHFPREAQSPAATGQCAVEIKSICIIGYARHADKHEASMTWHLAKVDQALQQPAYSANLVCPRQSPVVNSVAQNVALVEGLT